MNSKVWTAAVTLAVVLLSGCGSKPASQTNANSGMTAGTPQASSQQTQSSPNSPRPSMNPDQRTMMMTFQTLMMMDKADGLSLSKDEAVKLLPIVQSCLSKDELSPDDQDKIKTVLNDAQNKYMEERASQMQQRMAGAQGNGQRQGTGGQVFQRGLAKPDNSGNGNQTSQGGQRQRGGFNGGNIGQQLVELLQSKSK